MKMKINKACDLSSISVLPPPSRRSSGVLNGSDSSGFGKSQGTQLRSQTSQQSFSQGMSSQHGMFSQFSQNSLEDILTNEQRIGSEEKENPVKKVSHAMISNSREESQMVLSRPNNQLTKWKSTTSADQRSQKNEELENRLWSIENSLNRFSRILDSVQTDIMQANKGTKEVIMEMEGIRQKLTANDTLLQQMNKGQEDVKNNLVVGFKSISDQANQDLLQEKLEEISSSILNLKGHMDVSLQVLKPELCKAVEQQMQAITSSLKVSQQKLSTPIVVSPKATACSLKMSQQKHLPLIVASPKATACCLKMSQQKHLTPIVVSPKATAWSLKKPERKHSTPIVISPNGISFPTTAKQMPPLKKQKPVDSPGFRANQSRIATRSQVRAETSGKANLVPKMEVGRWTSVKSDKATVTYSRRGNMHKQTGSSPIELDREWRIPIELDEEINGGFSCLFGEKGTGNYLTADVKEETDRILRRARRKQRRSRNIIILN